MSSRVYKYPIPRAGVMRLPIPKGAEILTVQVQRGAMCLWARVDDNQGADEFRKIAVVGTGHPVPKDGRYIATVQFGDLVFHIFEQVGESPHEG